MLPAHPPPSYQDAVASTSSSSSSSSSRPATFDFSKINLAEYDEEIDNYNSNSNSNSITRSQSSSIIRSLPMFQQNNNNNNNSNANNVETNNSSINPKKRNQLQLPSKLNGANNPAPMKKQFQFSQTSHSQSLTPIPRLPVVSELPDDWISDNELSEEQRLFISKVLEGKTVFLTGSAGTGKSFVLKACCQRLRIRKVLEYEIIASTGTAAASICGRTLHSFLHVGLANKPIYQLVEDVYRSSNSQFRSEMSVLRIVFIDEISMLTPRMLPILNRICKAATGRQNLPFGGIQIVFIGDFLQLGCVIKDEDREMCQRFYNYKQDTDEQSNLLYHFLFEHPLWQQYVLDAVELIYVYRQAEDPAYAQMLNRTRYGYEYMTEDDHQMLEERARITRKLRTIENMADKNGIKPTRLEATNVRVDQVNRDELIKLQPDSKQHYVCMYHQQRSKDNKRSKPIFDTYIENMKANAYAPAEIRISLQSQVMLIYNVDVANHLTNGSRGIVVGFTPPMKTKLYPSELRLPIIRFQNNMDVPIEPVAWTTHHESTNTSCSYIQFPLRLANAITVHKSQGLSLDRILADLARMTQNSQGYTCLARCRSLQGVFLHSYNRTCIRAHPKAVAFYQRFSQLPPISNSSVSNLVA